MMLAVPMLGPGHATWFAYLMGWRKEWHFSSGKPNDSTGRFLFGSYAFHPPQPARFSRQWSASVLALLPATVGQESGV
jgi:hypothetical protein